MNIIRLYQDYNIPYLTEGHKHCREGWVNTPCPFCTGNAGYHLGYNLESNNFVCWRCGGHNTVSTLMQLLNIQRYEAYELVKKYELILQAKIKKVKVVMSPFKLPPTLPELPPLHRKYLQKRNFDPDKIISEWGIQATGRIATLDKINYRYRLIIPVQWQGQTVSFTSRDITDLHPLKYIACPENREKVNIKTILYGKENKWGDLGIVCEGATDVWRLGECACAVMGIKYKPAQVRVLSKLFKRVAVVFDDDVQAVKQAEKLVWDLRFRGVEAFRVNITGDPGAMSNDDAKALINELKTFKTK